MNVSELFSLSKWIVREIVNTQLPAKYQALISILQQYAQPNVQKQPFEVQKNDLIETLRAVPLDQLTKDQLDFLELLGIAHFVGEEGIALIEDVLYRNIIDVATSAQRLSQALQSVNNGIAKSAQIGTGLIDCVIDEEYESKNEVLMRISFTGHALMANVTDFKAWGDVWYDIGRGIAMAHDLTPEDVKIVGATKGSIILELAVIASIATTTSVIILAALKVAEKVLDIRIKAEDLRGLKLKNDKIANELEAEAANEKKAGINDITTAVVAQLKLKKDSEGDKVKALDTAVRNLVNFIEKGGMVDFILPQDEETPVNEGGNNEELRVAFQQIRQLEKKLVLLEHKIP